MYPVLRDNDIVIVKEVAPDSLQRGNILVYRTENGQYIVHRLVKKGEANLLHLKGDGYNLPSLLTKNEAIVGKVDAFFRDGRYEHLDRIKELHSWSVSLVKEYTKRFVRDAFRITKGSINR
jgi:signal peptidase I